MVHVCCFVSIHVLEMLLYSAFFDGLSGVTQLSMWNITDKKSVLTQSMYLGTDMA